jgi:hypothetical protein
LYSLSNSYLFLEPENEGGGSGLFLDKLEGSRKDNLRQRSILEMPMIRYYLPKEKTRTGLDGESLVIKPGFLKQGLTYFLQVKVTDEGQFVKILDICILFVKDWGV